MIGCHKDMKFSFCAGGNEYGQCGEEPERKDDTGRPLKRDIVIPQRCASKLSVRQVINSYKVLHVFLWFG